MKKGFEGLFIAAVVIIGGFFLYKSRTNDESQKNLARGSGEIIKQYGSDISDKKNSATSVPDVPAKKMDEDERSKYESKLRGEGYVDNPNDPYTLIKTVKKKDGKEVTYMMPKDPGDAVYLQPQERDKKIAEDILESKKDLNPAEEIQSLKRLDEKDQKTLMMLGRFRDESKDLEIFFGPASDEKGNPLTYDVLCLVSPKLNLNFKKNYQATVRTDDTGYVVIKASDQIFARVAWSFSETGRALHGKVYKVSESAATIITDFEAKDSSRTTLKYCD